jgi:hypothetical protein
MMTGKRRWTIFTVLLVLSLICVVSVLRLGAANPASGTIMPASAPLSWNGTAAGGVSGTGEATCVEGTSCDTFTLTVSGTPADWAGKRIAVALSWVLLASDYDLYVHKCPEGVTTVAACNAGPLIDSSTGFANTSEQAAISPTDLDADGTTVFTAHVVYSSAASGDQYRGTVTAVADEGGGTPPPPPARSTEWNIVYHGTCCEGNLSAAGDNTYVLLPVLVQGNIIKRSADGGKTWTQVYPPVGASVPFGIEGDMQAFGDDVIYFGTELATAVVAHSDDAGKSFTVTQDPVISPGNDQAWAYLGPLAKMNPTPLPTDEPYVLAGWFRIGSIVAFSFDGGLTFPVQTPLVGNNGSGPEHVACHANSTTPPATAPADSRIANALFARQKAGRHGAWGTDRKFYWSETVEGTLYVCQTADFGVNWSGVRHPVAPGPGKDFVVTHSAFDNNGTLYVTHGNKLYVSFNQGKTFAFVHTLPRYGDAKRSDTGADLYFAVDNGTIHIGLLEDAGEGRGRVYYLRGTGVDTAQPIWDEELVDEIGNIVVDGQGTPVRQDFMQIVLNGNGIPTLSYTTPDVPGPPVQQRDVTTASRNTPMPPPAGPALPARLQNISTRARVQTDDNVLIGGFIINGSAPKKVIVRGIGPSLQASGAPFPGRLEDPVLELYQQGNATPIATNDNWRENEADVVATGLQPTNDSEAAIVRTLSPGAYTAIVSGQNRSSGVALAEVYEVGGTEEAKLLNLSTRGFVEAGDNA